MSAMRKTLLPALLLVLGPAAAPVLPAAELVEQIVVRVNDRLITQSEFDRRLALASKAPNHPSDLAEMQKNVLEDLIREKLLEERAKEMSVSGDGRGSRGRGRPRQAAVQPVDRRRVRRVAGAVGDDARRAEAPDARDDHAPEGHRPRRHGEAGPVRRRAAARVRAAQGAVLRGPRVGARGRDRAQVFAHGRGGPPAGGRRRSRRSASRSRAARRLPTSPRNRRRGSPAGGAATSASSTRESSSRLWTRPSS